MLYDVAFIEQPHASNIPGFCNYCDFCNCEIAATKKPGYSLSNWYTNLASNRINELDQIKSEYSVLLQLWL